MCDIRHEDTVKQTVAAIVAAHGRIDGLVNNAGGQYVTPLEAISAKGWQAVIDINLTGGFLMSRECYLQSMAKTVPLGRFGTEAETSAGIVYLLSPAASFVTGTTLRIDGARPQVRMGWPMKVTKPEQQNRLAVKPFEGFHRAIVPKVFSK